jgi:predicted lipase
MNINKAILYAQLVNEAYAIDPNDTDNRAGKPVPAANPTYEVVTTIYANDLCTEINPERGKQRVSIGLILQSLTSGEVVIAIRGTEGAMEWIHDAQFLPVNCPFLPAAGNTEDGFTSMYLSMRTGLDAASPTVTKALTQMSFKQTVTCITICGHSLGGALATLLALDVAANIPLSAATLPFKTPTVYTYASPRTGDAQFVTMYNHVVPNTNRVANRVDLVPKLPLPPLYEHVTGLYDLSSVTLIPPKVLIKPELACLHILDSYLYLMSLQAGGQIPLEAKCAL